jgi:hypothetical protein
MVTSLFSLQKSVKQTEATVVAQLRELTRKHSGKVLFYNRFTLKDQVLCHLIFHYQLPIRVFTDAGNHCHDILSRSTDAFSGCIETTSRQSIETYLSWKRRFPERTKELNKKFHVAPLAHVLLSGNYILVVAGSGMEKGKRSESVFAGQWKPQEWHRMLEGWSKVQLAQYAKKWAVPLNTGEHHTWLSPLEIELEVSASLRTRWEQWVGQVWAWLIPESLMQPIYRKLVVIACLLATGQALYAQWPG